MTEQVGPTVLHPAPPLPAHLQTWQETLAAINVNMSTCSFGRLGLDMVGSVVADFANFNCSTSQLDM